jgi:hypothetical protein
MSVENSEYITLLNHLEILKTGKYDNKFIYTLHNSNLYYKENIIFDMEDKKQIKIKDLLYSILEIDYKKKKIYYCLKTKDLLQNIFDYIEDDTNYQEKKMKKKKIIVINDSDSDDDIEIKICKRKLIKN